MAIEGDKPEYESDPEDALLPSAMRRREASDDEDGERSDGGGVKSSRRASRSGIGSDAESDGQGAAPEYEDEELDAEYYEEEFEEEVAEELEEEGGVEDGGSRETVAPPAAVLTPESEGARWRHDGEVVGEARWNDQAGEEEEDGEEKENAPYAVPTVGAFYMHDDRFRPNVRGRHRRIPSGRKLVESKDDQAWVHDRFEELNLQDSHHSAERRTSRGRFRGRGRGRGRGTDRGFGRGNRSRSYDDGNNQNHAPKIVRGRGPRRYEFIAKNTRERPATQNKQYAKPHELPPKISAGRQSSHAPKAQPDPSLPNKNIVASRLNSASPPFYPSGSSNQDISMTQKKDAHAGINNRIVTSSIQMDDGFSVSQSGSLVRGKPIVDSITYEKINMNNLTHAVSGKTLATSQLQPSLSSYSPITTTQSSQSRAQTKGAPITGPSDHINSSFNQITRASSPSQPSIVQQIVLPTTGQSAMQISTQQMGQRPGNGIQAASPPEGPLRNSLEAGEGESPQGSSKSKTLSDGKGKMSNQVSGKGSYLYNQVLGAAGAMHLPHGDQGFPPTPALLPVMQFGGQHPGGIGVPAVGMALPGYVAQPQLGFGNSEMTWLPVLAGAAGALGASYCSPYIALDSSYYARTSGHTSSSSVSASREASTTKSADTSDPPQRPEIANDGLGQPQNKSRRYSEMNFGH